MRMDVVAGSGNDEFYTPKYAVNAIVGYIPSGSKIWCPFDTKDSMFVKIFKAFGHDVIFSHISHGQDFFEQKTPIDVDFIISNPPYSMKYEILKSLFERDVPFAMLLGVVGLFESQKRFELFRDNEFEVLYMNRRVSYFESFEDIKPSKNPPFSSVYICKDVLPKENNFIEIDKKDYV